MTRWIALTEHLTMYLPSQVRTVLELGESPLRRLSPLLKAEDWVLFWKQKIESSSESRRLSPLLSSSPRSHWSWSWRAGRQGTASPARKAAHCARWSVSSLYYTVNCSVSEQCAVYCLVFTVQCTVKCSLYSVMFSNHWHWQWHCTVLTVNTVLTHY